MPKVTRLLNAKLKSYILEFKSEIFYTDGKVLLSRICSFSINLIFNLN